MTACQERIRHGREVHAYSAMAILYCSGHHCLVHCPSEQPNRGIATANTQD